MASVGTLGDTLPFVAVGRKLRKLGHEVTFLGSEAFRSLFERHKIGFHGLISAAEHERQAEQRNRWSGRRALREGCANMVQDVPATYTAIRERHVPGQTVVVATGIMFGARIAQEKLKIPLVTVHLQPACFRADRDDLVWPSWMPRRLNRTIQRVADVVIDRALAPAINSFRRDVGLAPAARLMHEWWSSPQAVIGAFPEFMAPAPNAWSNHVEFVGFPENDGGGDCSEEEKLDEFLSRGAPPLVFCQTSAVAEARRFFEVSLATLRRLGRRGVLLSPRDDGLPADLGPAVLRCSYAPHGKLFPRAALVVHNGGIGTSGAALVAGTPQLLVPRFLDQPDNARRLRHLGVAGILKPAAYQPDAVERAIRGLLAGEGLSKRCQHFAALCRRDRAIERISATVERLGRCAPGEPPPGAGDAEDSDCNACRN
jgi:UDP:flavonoid glycosyltransferase YjiC (YdhE family)